ncbi:MAG: hypothetical protein ABSF28_14205 [Terracidiphilus sp.]|jgi:hypothetical protein
MAPNETIAGLEQWDVEIREVSMGWSVTRAVRKTGNLFEETSNDPEGFIQRLREFELEIQKALEERKLGASS